MATGKDICNQLRKVRVEIAKIFGIDFSPADCNHTGNCSGTCPMCEQELDYLERKIEEKKRTGDSCTHIESQIIIPVEKIEIDDSEKEEIKELIKQNKENLKSETMNNKQNVEHIDALQKSLSEEWAAIKFNTFSSNSSVFVTDGLIALSPINRFIRNENIKLHFCDYEINKAMSLEKEIDDLEKFRERYDNHRDVAAETLYLDKKIVTDRIELLIYNIEKIKLYVPYIIPRFDLDFFGASKESIKPTEQFEAIKRDAIYQINAYISRLAERWKIKNYELDLIGEHVDERIAKENNK